MTPDVTEIDYTHDEPVVVERAFTAAERAQLEADALAQAVLVEAARAAYERAQAARDAAIEHARSLGFTDTMIAAMWPALAEPAVVS